MCAWLCDSLLTRCRHSQPPGGSVCYITHTTTTSSINLSLLVLDIPDSSKLSHVPYRWRYIQPVPYNNNTFYLNASLLSITVFNSLYIVIYKTIYIMYTKKRITSLSTSVRRHNHLPDDVVDSTHEGGATSTHADCGRFARVGARVLL